MSTPKNVAQSNTSKSAKSRIVDGLPLSLQTVVIVRSSNIAGNVDGFALPGIRERKLGRQTIKVTEVENILCSSSEILKLELKLSRVTVDENLFGNLVAQNRMLCVRFLSTDKE